MHRSSTVYKPKQFLTNVSVDFQVRRQQRMNVFTGGSVSVDRGLVFTKGNGLELKMNEGFVSYKHATFLLHKTLNDGLEWCGLLVDYCRGTIRFPFFMLAEGNDRKVV